MAKMDVYQLWVHYSLHEGYRWVMEGLFETEGEAKKRRDELFNNVETPTMMDWAVIKSFGRWK